MFMMLDYARKMTMKNSSKYGGYGPFEYLLFLFPDKSVILGHVYQLQNKPHESYTLKKGFTPALVKTVNIWKELPNTKCNF